MERLVNDSMLGALNPQMKQSLRTGKFKWEYHGSQSSPRIAHVALAQLTTPLGQEELVQVTVKLNIKQVALPNLVNSHV